jgi:arylsulfatase A-like enzyme
MRLAIIAPLLYGFSMRRSAAVVWSRAVLAALAVLSASCGSGGGRPPNVLMIVIDTLRADRLAAYGNTRAVTPFLDDLAKRGTVFRKAYAVSSWTIPSVASLLTSRYSSQHHVLSFGSHLAEDELTFAEALQPLHYVAGGFTANFRLLQSLGYAQGFQFWRSDEKLPGGLSAAELRQQSLEWLDGAWHRGDPQPALLYFQFMEPHQPYDPPEPYRTQALAGDDPDALNAAVLVKDKVQGHDSITREDLRGYERLYDGEVMTVDAEIRTLFADLQQRGFLDNAIVIITADHGEEFWDHRDTQHGKTLFEESVRVPLLLLAPGYRRGQMVDENVSLIDIAPTLVDLLGLPPQPRFEGRSLAPLMEKTSLWSHVAGWFETRRPPRPDILVELKPKFGKNFDTRTHSEGIVRDSIKLLVDRQGGHAVYDLATDAGETNANPSGLATAAQTLATALDESKQDLAKRAGVEMKREKIDAATKEKLRQLGYQ